MPVTEHRFITIDNKIITLADVRKLANELYSHYKKRGKGKVKKFDIDVYCAEKVVFHSADPEIFSDDSPIASKRVFSIEMMLAIEPNEVIKIILKHDPSRNFDNQISVLGNDTNWVNGTLKRLEEIVDTFAPQNTTVRKYSGTIAIILALTIGLFVINLIGWAIALLSPSPPEIVLSQQTLALVSYFKIPVTIILFLLKYSLAAYAGSAPATSVIRWVKNLFPTVELQLGPEYKLNEKRKREMIFNIMSVTGIVSLLIQLIYDFASNMSLLL